MGLIKDKIDEVKDIKAKSDSFNDQVKIKKATDKAKDKFDSKKDKEISKLKQTEQHQVSIRKTDYRAYVVINLINGTLTEEIAVLGAEIGYKDEQPVLRVKDKDQKIIFEEPKPDAVDEFNYVDPDTVDQKIDDCKDALKLIQSGTQKEHEGLYESDWLQEYRKWTSKKAHIQLGEKGSYMKIRNGAPHYEFDLVGYFKIPVYRYTSKSAISIPPLGKIVTGMVLMKKINDEINSDQKDAQKLMNTIYGILIAIALIGSLILMYHSGQVDVQMSESFASATKNVAALINQSNELEAIRAGIQSINQTITGNITTGEPIKTLGKVLS